MKKLENNLRLGIMIKMIDNMKPVRKEKIFSLASNFVANTTSEVFQ